MIEWQWKQANVKISTFPKYPKLQKSLNTPWRYVHALLRHLVFVISQYILCKWSIMVTANESFNAGIPHDEHDPMPLNPWSVSLLLNITIWESGRMLTWSIESALLINCCDYVVSLANLLRPFKIGQKYLMWRYIFLPEKGSYKQTRQYVL